MKRLNVFGTAALVVLLIVCLSTVALPAKISQVSEAGSLVDALRKVRVGSSTETQTVRLLAPFSRFSSEKTDKQGVREIAYTFYNTEIRRITKGVPYTHLQIVLLFQNGIVVRKSMNMAVANGYAASVQQDVWRGPGDDGIGNHDPDRPDHLVQGNRNELGKYTLITVKDDSRLSPEQLSANWSINVSCLEKLGGCEDARQILPALGNDPVPTQR